jgi:O-antigen/teichoic acid export membrane protein
VNSVYLRLRRLLFSSAGVYFLATALARAGSLVLIPLYTRRLTEAQFGDYAVAQVLQQLALNLLSLGTVAAVTRFYFDGTDLAAARAKTGAAARFTMLLALSLAALTQVAIWIFGAHAAQRLGGRWELSCILWATVGLLFATIPASVLRASQRPILASLLMLFQFLSSVAAGIVLVAVAHRGLRGAIEALAVAGLINGTIGLIYVLFALPGRPTLTLAKESLAFSLPFVPHFVANYAGAASDRFVMKGVGHERELGAYALASQLTSPAQMVVQAWTDADSPRMGELYRTGGARALRADFRRTCVSYALASLVPGVGIVLGLPLLKLFVGARFSHALWPVPIMAALGVVESQYFPSVNALFYLKQTKYVPLVTASSAGINTLLNLLLIPFFGIWGALLARATFAFVRSGSMMLIARRCLAAPEAAASELEVDERLRLRGNRE